MIEHQNDYRQPEANDNVLASETYTPSKRIKINFRVGKLIRAQTDEMVRVAAPNAEQTDESLERAGAYIVAQWQGYVQSRPTIEGIFVSQPGQCTPACLILHAPYTTDHAERIQAICRNILTLVSQHVSNLKSMAWLLYGDEEDRSNSWQIAQAMLEAIKQFDNDGTATSLTLIEFFCVISYR